MTNTVSKLAKAADEAEREEVRVEGLIEQAERAIDEVSVDREHRCMGAEWLEAAHRHLGTLRAAARKARDAFSSALDEMDEADNAIEQARQDSLERDEIVRLPWSRAMQDALERAASCAGGETVDAHLEVEGWSDYEGESPDWRIHLTKPEEV